jgi:hypothetical protein
MKAPRITAGMPELPTDALFFWQSCFIIKPIILLNVFN